MNSAACASGRRRHPWRGCWGAWPLTASFSAGAPSGTLIAAITGLGGGETIASIAPNDGRLALDVTKRTLIVGLSAAAVGTIVATLTTSAGRSLVMSILASATGNEMVGGVAIGQAGPSGSPLEGLKLAAGDDFDVAPTRWNGRNLNGRYAAVALSNAFRQTNGADNAMYIDPSYRGARSESPVDLGQDRVSIAGSILTLTASVPSTEMLPFLPTVFTGGRGDANNRPKLLTGSLKTAPSFMVSAQADWAFDCLVSFDAGVARGYWPSYWITTLIWPDNGEVDFVEGTKNVGALSSKMNVIVSAVDGGGAQFEVVAQPAYPNDRYIRVLCVKKGGTISFYDDSVTVGVMELRGSTTTRVARVRGAHDVRLDLAVSEGWDGSTFSLGDWPKSVRFDWWRAWVPQAAGANTAAQILSPILTAPGGSWATTLPSRASLFGAKAGVEQVTAAWDNFDAPGMPTRNGATRLPASMSIDLSTRAVAGTIPSTEGGAMAILLTYAYDDGTPAARVFQPYHVAPAAQGTLFANLSIARGAAVSQKVAYTDFHSGNLGPHTYAVSKVSGGSWLTIAGNGTGEVTLSGTAPSADETVSLTVECTNAVGQKTTVNRTLTVADIAAFNPDNWVDAIEWFDASDNTKVYSDAAATTQAVSGTSVAAALVGRKIGAKFSWTDAGVTPDYYTDANGKKAIKWNRASNDRLVTTDPAIIANATGNDNAYAIVMAVKRGSPDVSVTPISFSRDTTGDSVNDAIRHYFSGTDAVGANRIVGGTSTAIATAAEVVPANAWYVVSWIFLGTTLDVRVNGSLVASRLALNANSLGLHHCALGGQFNNATKAFDAAFAFDGAIGEFGITQAIASNDATLAQAEAYLKAKWTN